MNSTKLDECQSESQCPNCNAPIKSPGYLAANGQTVCCMDCVIGVANGIEARNMHEQTTFWMRKLEQAGI